MLVHANAYTKPAEPCSLALIRLRGSEHSIPGSADQILTEYGTKPQATGSFAASRPG